MFNDGDGYGVAHGAVGVVVVVGELVGIGSSHETCRFAGGKKAG